MRNQLIIFVILSIASLASLPAYSSGYINIGATGHHGYGHISIGYGQHRNGHKHGGSYITGGYYSPPVITYSYSSHCAGIYCGAGPRYIRATPSVDYFRGVSDATSGINHIGCTH